MIANNVSVLDIIARCDNVKVLFYSSLCLLSILSSTISGLVKDIILTSLG